jgi:acetyl esterase/lipase
LLEHGAAELGSDRLLIGGESAGGHIAAVTVLRLRDRHDAADRLFGANLNCGVYDITGTPSRTLPPPDNDVLSAAPSSGTTAITYFDAVDNLRDPDVSPLYADLRGLCPAVHRRHRHSLDDSVFMAAGAGKRDGARVPARSAR